MSKVTYCYKCNQFISKTNLARHISKHDLIEKVVCQACGKLISKSNFSRHISTNGHKQRLTTLQVPDIQPAAGSVESWYQDFVATFNGPLAPLSDAYQKEIERAGGLSDLQPREAPMWTELGLRPPELLPANECWAYKPPLDIYMAELLCGFNKTTAIFSRGGPRQPLDHPPLHKVIEQLKHPDATSTYYATNMTAKSVCIKIPDRLYGGFPVLETDHEVTTNITPRFSGVDLHVDQGSHGLTLLHGGCVKLWALYPLTEHNRAKLQQAYQSNAMFIELRGVLEGGEFCIQTEDQALYLPPGCIHSTITLKGGLTPGIMFTTAECMKPSVFLWDIDTALVRTDQNDCGYFIRAVTMGLRSEDKTRQKEAWGLLCRCYQRISTRRWKELGEYMRGALPKKCTVCNQPWREHRCRRRARC
ncbi:hypothetical protein HD806DRAFT_487799 [Xylariaceae sp. AK1471]|nr:hypothetical protein HD806DRAFT_487799 [Xylariaceae sp. AK1471]